MAVTSWPCPDANGRDQYPAATSHQPVTAVDGEVAGDPHRDAEDADDVLDHVVGLVEREPGVGTEGVKN